MMIDSLNPDIMRNNIRKSTVSTDAVSELNTLIGTTPISDTTITKVLKNHDDGITIIESEIESLTGVQVLQIDTEHTLSIGESGAYNPLSGDTLYNKIVIFGCGYYDGKFYLALPRIFDDDYPLFSMVYINNTIPSNITLNNGLIFYMDKKE